MHDEEWIGIKYKESCDINYKINKNINWNGEGFEYYDNGKIKFKGEYLNGERNGKAIEYESNWSEIIFEGEYINGKKKK